MLGRSRSLSCTRSGQFVDLGPVFIQGYEPERVYFIKYSTVHTPVHTSPVHTICSMVHTRFIPRFIGMNHTSRIAIYFWRRIKNRAHMAMSHFEAVQGLLEEGAPGLVATWLPCGAPLPELTALSGRATMLPPTLGYLMHLH